jgi:hypothetical protein
MHSTMPILAFTLFKTNGTHSPKGKGKGKFDGFLTVHHSVDLDL